MNKPGSPWGKRKAKTRAGERLRRNYLNKKVEYLELCWRYNLPPRDLSLFLMGKRNIDPEDRVKLIRLVIELSRMERLMDPHTLTDFLFAEDESAYLHSAVFAPSDVH